MKSLIRLSIIFSFLLLSFSGYAQVPITGPGITNQQAPQSGYQYYDKVKNVWKLIPQATLNSLVGSNLLITNNTWTGTNTYNGVFAVNAPATFSASLAVNGSSTTFNSTGNVSFNNGLTLAANKNLNIGGGANLFYSSGSSITGITMPGGTGSIQINGPAVQLSNQSGNSSIVANNNGTTQIIGTTTTVSGGPLLAPNFYATSAHPTFVAGPGAGTSPTITIVGTNLDGVITITFGTAPSTNAYIAHFTMSGSFAYPTACAPVISLVNNTTAVAANQALMVGFSGVNDWYIYTNSVAPTAGTYQYTYHCGGY